jgi:hypothetical protein
MTLSKYAEFNSWTSTTGAPNNLTDALTAFIAFDSQ